MPIATAPLPKRLLTYREAAQVLGVSERSIYAWISSGAVTPTRIGRLVRLHVDEVERIAREGVAQ